MTAAIQLAAGMMQRQAMTRSAGDRPTAANDPDPGGLRPWDARSDELVTYRYFGCRSNLIDREHSTGSMPISDDMRASGGLMMAPLAIAMLAAAGITLDRYYQLWLTQIEINLFEAGLGVDRVNVEHQILREARTQAFSEGRILQSPQGRVIGQGSANWAVLSHTATDFEYREQSAAPTAEDKAQLPPLHEVFGAQPMPGGYRIAALSNRIGAHVLHHGPMLVLMEQASLDVAKAVAGTADIRPKMLSCQLMKAGRSGPFSIRSELYNHSADLLTCRATVCEEGRADSLLAVMFWQARLL